MQKEEKYTTGGHQIVEVGFLLHKSFEYYHKMLIDHNVKLQKTMYTHDQYWTDKDLTGMTEKEMKKACVRYREYKQVKRINASKFEDLSNVHYCIDNLNLFDKESHSVIMHNINAKKATDLILPVANTNGWDKVFDTTKIDYQYKTENMNSVIQLQQIEGIGLVVYYDNPAYYHMTPIEQKKALIDELNQYGFDFNYKTQGIDKLRSLYYKELHFSSNQNI